VASFHPTGGARIPRAQTSTRHLPFVAVPWAGAREAPNRRHPWFHGDRQQGRSSDVCPSWPSLPRFISPSPHLSPSSLSKRLPSPSSAAAGGSNRSPPPRRLQWKQRRLIISIGGGCLEEAAGWRFIVAPDGSSPASSFPWPAAPRSPARVVDPVVSPEMLLVTTSLSTC
jgi:hypothetical protein